MALKSQNSPSLFLEEWLRNSSLPSPKIPIKPTSAQSIIQAWSHLRDHLSHPSSQPHLHLQSLLTLTDSIPTLHVADPQAKLLISLLSSLPNSSLPTLPILLRLLYVWVRKSSRLSPPLLDSLLLTLGRLLSAGVEGLQSSVPEAVLLLGAISAVPRLSETSRKACYELLCELLERQRPAIRACREFVPEVLAGIGYALVRSEIDWFRRIFGSLLGFWRDGPCACMPHGVMIFQLAEWLVSGFVGSRALARIEIVCGEISEFRERNYFDFAVIMAAGGVLRALNRASSLKISPQLKNSVEGTLSAIAGDLILKIGNFSDYRGNFDQRLVLQCIAMGLARSGPISFHAPLFLCLAYALLNEIFPLQSFYEKVIKKRNGDSTSVLLTDEVKEHLGNVLFKEAGAVTGAFCDQYALADEESKIAVENSVWIYCHESYLKLRLATMLLRADRNELLAELEKVAEAAFLMVVIFASTVAKHRVNSKFSKEVQSETSVKILVAFSCIEYLRRVRLPEYSETIRRVVLSVQEHVSAGCAFVESMPAYADLTALPGLIGMEYIWKVAQASHSVFAAFMSSGKDDQDDRVLLKEQLVFYYMQRSLEAYPGITPIEGMASGVAAIVRHLPAGSPSIFYCVHSLAEKVTSLCSKSMSQDVDMWKNWKGESEPTKKILELLLRLMSLVDIQVLPDMLKLLAQLIVQLPKDGQNLVLDEIYSQVAESDDVSRKPTLVSWVQSLSYLCHQEMDQSSKKQSISTSSTDGSSQERNNSTNTNALSLYGTSSRL
ncbi:hypothetical protein ACLOJK_040638 [Asimina triloba]